MKKNLRLTIISAAFAVVFGYATQSFAQTNEPMAGGYAAVDATDARIVAAANFAVKTQAKKQRAKIRLTTIKKAEQQVVAGMNYEICLQVDVREKGKKTFVPQTVQTVVFLNLKQKYELTSWAVAACAEEMPPEMPVK